MECGFNRLKLNADKTELLWVGSRHSLSQQDCCVPVLQLCSDSTVARDHVRLLGATLSSDLSFNRQRVQFLLVTPTSAISAFTRLGIGGHTDSRIDYCNAVLAGAPKAKTNKLKRVLNAAARAVSGMHKFDRGFSRLLHAYHIEINRLDVPERVVYKLGVMVFNCLHGQVLLCLAELCQPVKGIASRQHLRSATRQLLVVYHATGSAPMADGFSVWLVRRSGIHCRTACGIRFLAETVLDNL